MKYPPWGGEKKERPDVTIVHLLERNAKQWPEDSALVEINPDQPETRRVTWHEFELVEPSARTRHYRREITWAVFNEKANRIANMLKSHGIGKGNKVAILLMNCIDWLPIYFGILKTGALAVPMNFRYAADEIEYCLNLSESNMLVFGPEFIGRVESVLDRVPRVKNCFYVGDDCPTFADSYDTLITYCSSIAPSIYLTDEDDGAIYFSSGTTGFPKAILHKHASLSHSAKVEQAHHGQTRDDVFLLIPPLYHTGAKMHWFGSFLVGGRAVLLKGVKPEWILRAASEEKCTIVWLLVPWAQDILDAIERGDVKLEDYQLSQWRLMHIGAQPVPPALIKRWKTVFPHHDYDTNYGLSESTGPGCVHLGIENIDHVGAIGVPGYRWECKICDETGNVSWLLFTGAELLARYNDNAPDGNTFLTDPEACPRPCYRWYKYYESKEYRDLINSSDYAPSISEEAQQPLFSLTNEWFDPNIWEKGTFDESTGQLVTGQYGFGRGKSFA